MSQLFISHASEDTEQAKQLRAWLKAHHFHSIFLDASREDGIKVGENWESELYRRLGSCSAVIALNSKHFHQSQWCFAEVTSGRGQGKPVLSLRLDDEELHPLLSRDQSVDFRGDEVAQQRAIVRLVEGLIQRGIYETSTGPWDASREPFPGLRAFEEEDAPVFFGRESAIEDGLQRLDRLRQRDSVSWFMVLGASGAGKSSLVRAGLLPRLQRNPACWIVGARIRPGSRPFDALAIGLAETWAKVQNGLIAGSAASEPAVSGPAASGMSPLTWQEIRKKLREAGDGELCDFGQTIRGAASQLEAKVVLFVDQLEELLSGHGHVNRKGDAIQDLDADRLTKVSHDFLSLLRRLAELRESPFLILSTLRSDFLGDFQLHPALTGVEFEDLILGPMTKAELRATIERPAQLAGIQLETGLVEIMLDDAQTSDALPLLAFTLQQLYQRFGEDYRLEISEYRNEPDDRKQPGLGGLKGAIETQANEVLKSQGLSSTVEQEGAPELPLLRTAFLALARQTSKGSYVRRRVRWSDLPSKSEPWLEALKRVHRRITSEGGGFEGW